MFSFFSCDFGLKENEETNSKEYFTVKGSCSIQGAIPSDLLPEKSIKQNAQRTVVPKIETDVINVIFESETKETKTAEVVNNDGVLNFEVELPAGKWTVKAQGKKSDVVIIKSESYQIELSAENKSENVALVLKPTQSDTGEGTFEFSFDMNTSKVSGMKYTYEKNGSTEPPQTGKIDDFSAKKNIKLSSGVYTFRFDFYSDKECTGELLYSFTEVVNIFDGLTTDTWITAGEYIDGGKICITNDMISKFVSTTVYVSEFGNDSNFGTFFAPVTTIQKAVDKVIAMHKVTASSVEKPYKILLLSDIYTSSNNSFENNNNAFVNIDLSSASASENPLYLEISKYGDGNATINANRSSSNTGRVMYIGENANVTLKNLILTGGYLKNDENKNGGGIYSKGNCNLNSCTISGNTAKASSGSVRGGGVYIESGSFTMEGCTISGNTAGSETSDAYANANAYGGGIFGASGTNITMNDTTISENKVASVNGVEGAGVCLHGANLTMNGGLISKNECSSDSSSFGGGVYVSDGTFSMEGDAVVDSSNDVYLKTGKTITISGELTFNGSIATITPEKYAEKYEENYKEVQVLAAGTGITLSEQVEKFSVTQSDEFETEITNEGCLKNTLKRTATLTEELYDICSTIYVNSADGMNAISDLSQTGNDFAGKTIILEDNINLGSEYMLIKTFSGVFEGKKYTIKLNKPNEYDLNNYSGGAIFNVITGKDAKVSDLNVSGEAYIAGIAIELKNDAVISKCTNNATITSPNGEGVHGCGGIVGQLSNGGVIENCINNGAITYNSTNDKGCGGIVGAISSSDSTKGNSIIANCINNGVIKRVQKEGNVEQDVNIGGICGEVTGNAAIYNCVNTGSVTSELTDQNATENIGGIIGYCSVSFYTTEFTSLPGDMGIFNCYNSGSISSTNNSSSKYVGGIVGKGYVYTSTQYSLVHTIRVTNTVNNDDTTYAFGNITLGDSSTYFEIKDNFFKKGGSSPNYSSYESTFSGAIGVINSVVNTLNEYSIYSNGKYLQWRVDGKGTGDIIFSEEIIGNQEITP